MGDNRTRFEALDSWRGLCALAVVFFHFPIVGPLRSFPLVANGYLFVDFFFVLSGFVIATVSARRLGAPGDTWRFLLRRFGRIWPLHVVLLGLFVLAAVVQGDIGSDERHSYNSILSNLFMVHGLGIHDDLTWNGPSWSISVEAALYLLFGVVTLRPRSQWIFAGLAMVGWVTLAVWAPNGIASTFDFGICRGLAGFFVGALLTRAPAVRTGTRAEVVTVMVVGLFVTLSQWTLLAPAVFGGAVYVFAHSRGAISGVLTAKPLQLLGRWSYSTYMVHAALVAVIWSLAPKLGLTRDGGQLIGSAPVMWAVAAVYLTAVLATSAATFTFIEAPARDYFNRLAARRAPATA